MCGSFGSINNHLRRLEQPVQIYPKSFFQENSLHASSVAYLHWRQVLPSEIARLPFDLIDCLVNSQIIRSSPRIYCILYRWSQFWVISLGQWPFCPNPLILLSMTANCPVARLLIVFLNFIPLPSLHSVSGMLRDVHVSRSTAPAPCASCTACAQCGCS